MHGTSGMSLTCHKNSRAVERILPQTEKLKKMKSKGLLEPGGIDHSESSRNNQSELIRNSQCTSLAN